PGVRRTAPRTAVQTAAAVQSRALAAAVRVGQARRSVSATSLAAGPARRVPGGRAQTPTPPAAARRTAAVHAAIPPVDCPARALLSRRPPAAATYAHRRVRAPSAHGPATAQTVGPSAAARRPGSERTTCTMPHHPATARARRSPRAPGVLLQL